MDGRLGRVAGAGCADLVEHLGLEGHGGADGRDEGRQLVVALLEGHVDVGPGPLAAALQADDVVVGDDREEADQHDAEDGGDQERQLDRHGHADMLSMTPSASALKTAIPTPTSPSRKAGSWCLVAAAGPPRYTAIAPPGPRASTSVSAAMA